MRIVVTQSCIMKVMVFPKEAFLIRMYASRKLVSKMNRSNGEDIYGETSHIKLKLFTYKLKFETETAQVPLRGKLFLWKFKVKDITLNLK